MFCSRRIFTSAGVRASATTLCCRSPGLPPRERRLHTADSVRGYFGSDRAGSWAADAARLLFTGAIGTAHFSSGATGTALFILNCQAFLIVGLPRRLDARKDSRQVRGLPAIHRAGRVSKCSICSLSDRPCSSTPGGAREGARGFLERSLSQLEPDVPLGTL